MHVRILGSAAGGGFPQWNCGCANCNGVRTHALRAKPRTQSQVAVSEDRKNWHLLNASPDLRQQLLGDPALQANGESIRNSPICSIHLTNADLDHTLGLLLLRESQPLKIYSTARVRDLLRDSNAYFQMLNQFDGQTQWEALQEGRGHELSGVGGRAFSKIRSYIHPLKGHAPYWARGLATTGDASSAVVGLVLESSSGSRLGYFPGVGEIDQKLIATLSSCDAILFDGTFWDEDELSRLHPGSRTAKQMQHVPISGPDGSLRLLSDLPQSVRKIYTHINNTNPILNDDSAEARAVREAGWEISFDQMEFTA